MAYRKKTKNIGGGRKITQTILSDGSSRITHTKKVGNITQSTSVTSGGVRTTNTTRLNGGWVDRKTRTTGKPTAPKAPRKSSQSTRRPSGRRAQSSGGAGPIILAIIVLLIFGMLS